MPIRHRFPALLAGLLGFAFAAAAAGPVLAKEAMTAALDAPVARDTPAGTILRVGFSGWVNVSGRHDPVEGTPFYIRLTGGDGSETRAPAAVDPSGSVGHYVARVIAPAGGIVGIEIGVTGSSDLPIAIAGVPLLAGVPGPGTAPVVPGSGGAAAPGPAGIGTLPSVPPTVPWPAIAIVAVVLGLAAVAIAAAGAGRRRRAAQPAAGSPRLNPPPCQSMATSPGQQQLPNAWTGGASRAELRTAVGRAGTLELETAATVGTRRDGRGPSGRWSRVVTGPISPSRSSPINCR